MTRRVSPATRRYLRRLWPTLLVYVVLLLATNWWLETAGPVGLLRYVVAVVPALPLVVVIYLVAQLMYGKEDEFQRALWVEGLLWATAITLAATTVWGFLENAGAPSIRLYWVFPFYTGALLLLVPLLARKYQ